MQDKTRQSNKLVIRALSEAGKKPGQPARPDGLPDPTEHTDAPPEMRNKLPSRVHKGLPDKLKLRPPEGGPMPDAKNLDPAVTAMALWKAHQNGWTDEIEAYAEALNNDGMSPADLLKLSAMIRMMRNGGAVLGAIIDAMEGQPGPGPDI